jgi:predicted esterase
MIVRHYYGAPLRPGETYAYLVKTSVVDDKGANMQQDDDFKVLLAEAQPGDAALAAAWRAYAPLRAWIADKKIDATTIAAAAVFTTQKTDEPLFQMRAAVRAAAAPVVKSLTDCADAPKSPCDDGKVGAEHTRGCMGVSSLFAEYQGLVSIPVFQKGTPPYDQPTDGGGIEYEGGMARIQRTEDVCFALTVPRGAMPAGGWPVVVYSHGTGGGYRSFIEQKLAAEFAQGDSTTGAPPLAMLGYDGALHANRKGTSTRPVTELFYNFQNPLAARDNSLQAAGDLFAIARALEGFSAGAIKIDATKLSLYGHSQGGNAAADAMPFEPAYGAVVLSGTGGTLILSLLNKTQPVNIASLIPFALGEAKVSADHPVLNLLQMYLDRADPVNFGRRLFAEPLAPAGPPARPARLRQQRQLRPGPHPAQLRPVGRLRHRGPGDRSRRHAGHRRDAPAAGHPRSRQGQRHHRHRRRHHRRRGPVQARRLRRPLRLHPERRRPPGHPADAGHLRARRRAHREAVRAHPANSSFRFCADRASRATPSPPRRRRRA